MSHEIRTPMNAIMDSQVVLNRFDFETKEYLNAIKWGDDALIVLINDFRFGKSRCR
jgi:signal transduction histidine kinase